MATSAPRRSASQRGYDRRWRKARARFLALHPLCLRCAAQGLVVEATVVDHINPHRGDPDRFWDRANWQPLCTTCHNRHKQREERRGYSIQVGPDGWPVDPRHPANRSVSPLHGDHPREG